MTPSAVTTFRRALVDHLAGALDLVGIPHPPATLKPGQLFFKPGAPYVSWEAPGTFTAPVLRFTVVIVAATNDMTRTWEWLDEAVSTMRDVLQRVTRIGPFPRPALLSIGAPGPLEGTDFYAIEATFAPVPIGALT